MFCVCCGKKFDDTVFACEKCGNVNKLEPSASHIKLRPKALPFSDLVEEKMIAESECKTFSKVIVTNKRVILSGFFSGRRFYLNNIRYAEYTSPDKSDFYRGGLIGYISKKIFSDGIIFFGEGGAKIFELKGLKDAASVMSAFNAAKFGAIAPHEFLAMSDYSDGGIINGILSAIQNIVAAPGISGKRPLYNENAYLGYMPAFRPPRIENPVFLKGKSYFETGDFEKAQLALQSYCAENPRSEEGFIYLAVTLDNLSRFDEAIIIYDRALAINKTAHYTLKMQAYSLYRAGRCHEACDNFDKAADIFAKSLDKSMNSSFQASFLSECAFGAACCHHKIGNICEAVASFERALSINDGNASAWIKKGFCHQELGEFAKARGCYDAAAKIMRNASASAVFYSAIALCECGNERFKDALELFNICSLTSPPESDLKREAEAGKARISDISFASWLKSFFKR